MQRVKHALLMMFAVVVLMSFCSASAFAGKNNKTLAPGGKYVEGELLVKFKSNTKKSAKAASHKANGGKKIKKFKNSNLHHIRLGSDVMIEKALDKYRKDPNVEYVEPNYIAKPLAIPNDPLFPSQWYLSRIDATAAWDIETGDGTTIVVVIDTGVEYTHSDLAANMWVNTAEQFGVAGVDDDANGYVDDIYGIDPFEGDSDPLPTDSHGTQAAGIIGAVGNDGVGTAGINWNIKIMACRAGDMDGLPTSAIIECFDYAKTMSDMGEPIVATSNSYGSRYYTQSVSDTIAAQSEILMVAAAGNDNTDNDELSHYPSGYSLPNVIAVGGTAQDDSTLFNYGRRTVEISAPGIYLMSPTLGNTYGNFAGTSGATPSVAGVAALLKSDNNLLTRSEIKNLIITGGESVIPQEGQTISGKIVNALGSLTCMNQKLLSAIDLPKTVEVGTPATLKVMSIDCAASAGPVTVTTTGGSNPSVADDGIAPDIEAGDGIFTGSWTPAQPSEVLTFTSPAGSESIRLPMLKIALTRIPHAQLDNYYRWTLPVTGGLAPYSFGLVNGMLPAGMSLDPASGELTGAAAMVGDFDFLVEVTDAEAHTATRQYSLRVAESTLGQRWAGFEPQNATGIALDSFGNVYVSGYGIDPMNGFTNDYMTMRYSTGGGQFWYDPDVPSYDSGGDDYAKDVAVSSTGDLFVTGYSMNPMEDWATLSYNSNGLELWPSPTIYDNFGPDFANAIAVDSNASAVYVAGVSFGAGGDDIVIAKYDTFSGMPLWMPELSFDGGGADGAADIVIDDNGNIFVTGYSHNGSDRDFWTMKYDSNGLPLWAAPVLYDGGYDDYATGIALDMFGGVMVTGSSFNGQNYDIVVAYYDSLGSANWAIPPVYDSGDDDYASAIGRSPFGDNSYVAGYVVEQGANVNKIVMFDNFGALAWADSDPGYFGAFRDIVVDIDENLYVAGDSGTISYNVLITILDSSLADGRISNPYSHELNGAGGVGGYFWYVDSGMLPPGLTLDTEWGELSGTPTIAGSYDFTLLLSDGGFESAIKSFNITISDDIDIITNILPVGTEGTFYTQLLTAIGGVEPYTWSLDSGTMPSGVLLDSMTGEISGIPTGAGIFNFTVMVQDSNGYQAIKSLVITIDPTPNTAPVAEANGPYSGIEGQAVAFSSAGSTDADGDAITYLWEFGDGNQSSLENPSHTYASAGSYTVTLTVTDPSLDTGVDTASVTIDQVPNTAPVAEANGPYSGTEGQTVSFSSAGSTDADADTITYLWEFGDGNQSSLENPSHTYASAGSYTVTLTVTDPSLDTGVDTASATVSAAPNVAPVAEAGSDIVSSVRQDIGFDGSASYDSDGTITSYSWDFGDGKTASGQIAIHAYRKAGSYTVTLIVEDDSGATAQDSLVVTVTK